MAPNPNLDAHIFEDGKCTVSGCGVELKEKPLKVVHKRTMLWGNFCLYDLRWFLAVAAVAVAGYWWFFGRSIH